MCIKNMYHDVYVDGERDVTERVDACHSDTICRDPTVREFDRKINCTKLQLSDGQMDARPGLETSIDHGLLDSDGGPHATHPMPMGYGPDSQKAINNAIDTDPQKFSRYQTRPNYDSGYRRPNNYYGQPSKPPVSNARYWQTPNHVVVRSSLPRAPYPPTTVQSHSDGQLGQDPPETITGSSAILVSRSRDVTDPGVQRPVSPKRRFAEHIRRKGKEIEDDVALGLERELRDQDVAWRVRDGRGAQREQDSKRYRVESDTHATLHAELRDFLAGMERTGESRIRKRREILETRNQLLELMETYIQEKRNGENGRIQEARSRIELNRITQSGLDSSSIIFHDASTTHGLWDGEQMPAPTFSKEPGMQFVPISKPELTKTPVAPHSSPTAQSNAMLYTPDSLACVDESFDDIPVGPNGGTDFTPFPEVQSGHRSDSFDANRITPTKLPATLDPKIGNYSGASIVGTSELDDKSSIPSYTDSIFDDLESVLSSVSSLGDGAQAVFVGAFVDLLIRDPTVDRMIFRATSDAGIGLERFRRSFSRILKAYSRDLRDSVAQEQQKEHTSHQRVAVFISRKTRQASSLLATRYKERAPKPDNNALDRVAQYLDGLESDNSDSSDEEEGGTEPTVAGVETFLLEGKPFRNLKWHLRSLIIPNQRVAQVKTSAEHLLKFVFCDLGLEETFARAYGRVPNFSAWLRLRIDALAETLETELKERSFLTEYLGIYSDYLAAQAVQKLGRAPNVSDAQHSESSPFEERGKEQGNVIRPPEEILEDIMVARLPEVFGGEFSKPTAWAGLLSTKSFREFTSDLSNAAYPTFFSESRKALEAEVGSEDHEPSAQSEEGYLLSILMELQWCSTRHDRALSLSVESSDSVLWLDRFKLSIEKSSGSEWSWWPLPPPPRAESPAYVQLEPLNMRQQLSSPALWLLSMCLAFYLSIQAAQFADGLSQQHVRGYNDGSFWGEHLVPTIAYAVSATPLLVLIDIAFYALAFTWRHVLSKESQVPIRSHEEHGDCAKVISWLCVCGCTRRELVSPKYGNLFQELASKYPMAHYDNNSAQSNKFCVPPTPSQISSGGSSSSVDTQSVGSLDSTGGGSRRASISTAPSSTGSTAITLDFDRQTFVHLLVRKAHQYVLTSMKVNDTDARGFFQDLIVRYQQQRGFLRRFLSIFVYSHCDFVKVKHHRAFRVSPIPGFSFPEPGKDIEYHEYTYGPQPMIQVPITKHMFNDYFYSCYNSENMKHSFLHKFLSSCDVIETLPKDLMEGLPKRDREVMVGARFDRVEHFWGIVAREQRSALRVVLYMLLSLAPTIWFAFMWMFSWGHEGDLQNATVPVTISIATLSMVWVVVYSGQESANE